MVAPLEAVQERGTELQVAEPPPSPSPKLTLKSPGKAIKLAATLLAPSIVTEQAPVPEQSPDQPVKVEPEKAVAVKVTGVL